MKKMTRSLLAAVITGCLTMNAAANVCPFTDHFVIESTVPIYVINASTKGNLSYEQITANYFRLSCGSTSSTAGGDLYLEVGLNNSQKCSLVIHDGPYVMNPAITDIYCGGANGTLHFMGLDHPFGSYNYTLKFAGG